MGPVFLAFFFFSLFISGVHISQRNFESSTRPGMVGPSCLSSILRNTERRGVVFSIWCSVFGVWCSVFAVSGGIMVCALLVCEDHLWFLSPFCLALRVMSPELASHFWCAMPVWRCLLPSVAVVFPSFRAATLRRRKQGIFSVTLNMCMTVVHRMSTHDTASPGVSERTTP